MVKYLKNYSVINSEIPIIDVEFENLPEDIIIKVFDENNFKRNVYGNLSVQTGRFTLSHDIEISDYEYFKNEFSKTLRYISLELFKLDIVRYPIHGIDRETWFDKKFSYPYQYLFLPTIDKSGFFMPWHLDNRLIAISGSINIQDNFVSTIFNTNHHYWKDKNYIGNQNDLLYIGRQKKFTGTFWLNTEKTWHAVPEVTKERKTLLFNVFF
jgi:hypothetical protein